MIDCAAFVARILSFGQARKKKLAFPDSAGEGV